MKEKAPIIAGGLLGLLFIVFGLNHFIGFLPAPPSPPEGSPPAMFFGSLYVTDYLSFIKVVEIIGGVLVAIPLTRNFGLLALGPIVVNILAFNIFMTKGAGLLPPAGAPAIIVTALSAYLLWCGRKKFASLLNQPN
jgi:putative oxidoreductase